MLTASTRQITQRRGNVITTAPSVEPITLAEAKAHMAVDHTADDAVITMMITAARQYAEEMTGLAFITQTWTLALDGWPAVSPWWDGVVEAPMSIMSENSRKSIDLPRYPLQTVTSITTDGAAVDIGATFIIDSQRRPGRLVIKSGTAWPSVVQNANGISIVYVAGFGLAVAVPAAIKLGLLQMVAFMYTNRGDGCSSADAWAASGAQNVMMAYRSRGL